MPDPPPGGPTALPHHRAGPLRQAGIGGLLACYAAVLVFLRGRPTTNGDGGIFLSVTAALRHGYTLYSGVWDNKPPLFYYGGALGAMRILAFATVTAGAIVLARPRGPDHSG